MPDVPATKSVEDRLAYLEEKVAALIKIKNENTAKLVTKSLEVETITVKNGEHPYFVKITASPTCAGMWVAGDSDDGCVSIYNTKDQGGIIGVYGNPMTTALDIAMSAKDGPVLQVFDRAASKVYMVTPSVLAGISHPTTV
jgi:hypothetical protein